MMPPLPNHSSARLWRLPQGERELRIPIPDPFAGSEDEPFDAALMPWIDRGFRVVCVDSRRGEYEARMSVPIVH